MTLQSALARAILAGALSTAAPSGFASAETGEAPETAASAAIAGKVADSPHKVEPLGVDGEAITKYQRFGIELEERSVREHHILPVPAAHVIDRTGETRYAYWNADYKKRIRTREAAPSCRGGEGGE